jgi:excisionase family DNA binding protein
MTPEEVVELLRLHSIKTLYAWHYQGTGPRVTKVGRHLRYRRADLDAWLDQQASPAAAG